jgi:hypothetical protein
MTPKEQHKIFWNLYPPRYSEEKKPLKERKKTKVGMYPCQLWFEAKKPDDETFSKMCEWVKTLRQNYEHCLKKGEFHRAPKDPLRFLKDRGWYDEIEPMTGIIKKKTVCCVCGGDASTQVKGRWYCGNDNPYGRVKFIRPESSPRTLEPEPVDTNLNTKDSSTAVPGRQTPEAGSSPVSNTRICGMCKMGRAKHQTKVDFITMNVCDKCYSLSKESGETSAPSKEDYKARIEQATKGFFKQI